MAPCTLSRTTRVSRYQKDKTRKANQSGFTGARDSEWQWHQLGHMQICISPRQIIMPVSHHSIFYRLDALPAAQPTAHMQMAFIMCIIRMNHFIFIKVISKDDR